MTNENPVSVVSSALTVSDDDKLIHKSNLVSTMSLTVSLIEIFSLAAVSAGLLIFTTGGYDSSERKRGRVFSAGKKKSSCQALTWEP